MIRLLILLIFAIKLVELYAAGNDVYSLSTVVGEFGKIGNKNGIGTESLLNNPYGLIYNPRIEALIIADTFNHLIRRISLSDYVVTTFAGRGDPSFVNGFGTRAAFYSPFDIVYCDKLRNYYVADNDNNMIRQIAESGRVTTLAGQLTEGFSDGKGSKASFYWPWSLTCSDFGLIYVADTFNYAIRRISSDGTVNTLAGDGKDGMQSGEKLHFLLPSFCSTSNLHFVN